LKVFIKDTKLYKGIKLHNYKVLCSLNLEREESEKNFTNLQP
jgi:hypothetical protein